MEDLILQFGEVGFKNPYEQLMNYKDLAASALVDYEEVSGEKEVEIYLKLEKFNFFVRENVCFNPEFYAENPTMVSIVKRCNLYYQRTFEGNYRSRILNCLLLYENISMVV